jgi:Protein of unknown function (DUF1552)
LPLLHSLMPRTARAAGGGPLRFVGMFAPNGIVPSLWRPTTFGTTFDLPLSLAPLASVRQKVSVISNLNLGNDPNMGSHDGGRGLFLTASRLAGASSIDQVIGKLTEASVSVATLNLGIENNGYYWPSTITPSTFPMIDPTNNAIYSAPNGEDRQDRCSDTACVVSMSQGATQANIYHPQVAFEKLFGSGGSGASSGGADGGVDPKVLKDAARRRRVVDAIKGHANALKTRISTSDATRVDEYLEGVRRIEVELDKIQASAGSGSTVSATCDRSTPVSGIPVDREKYAKLMCDLIVRAFQCDATRAATYMLGECVSPMSFVVDGVTYSHHGDASHHGSDPLKTHAKGVIDAWQVSIFTYLVDQLSKVTDSDGTALIDRTALYYGSDIADSDLHDAVNMPVLLGGALGGALNPGRHIDGQSKHVGDLFVTILAAFGVTGTFGEFGLTTIGGL